MKLCQVTVVSVSPVEIHWLPSLKQAKSFVKEKSAADPGFKANILEVEIAAGKKNFIAWLNAKPAVDTPAE